MAGFALGLGPTDWLKMANPLKTVAPIASTGASPKPVTLSGSSTATSKPAPTPSPLGGGQSTPAPGASPTPNAGTWGNILLAGQGAQPATQPPPAAPAPAPIPSASAAAPASATTTPTAPTAGGASGSGAPAPLAKTTADTTGPSGFQAPSTPAATPVPQNTDVAAPMPKDSQPITFVDKGAQNTDVAAPAATPPITFQDQTPQNTNVATPTPQTMANGGQAQPDGAGNMVPTSTVVTPPKATPSLDDNMALYEKTAQDWMNGKVDQAAFQTTANRAILQMGLSNSSDLDALKMRINSDPSLAGQGAGSAMLSMMAANQNFNADQLFGQLAQSAQQKILDMQKYGLQMGVQINAQRRQDAFQNVQALYDAGDFTGGAKLLAKTIDFPGVAINPTQISANRTRLSDDAQSLMASGDYEGAAAKLSAMTGATVSAAQIQQRDPFVWQQAANLDKAGDFAGEAKLLSGNGITVTADDLRARSPFQQETWTNTLDAIKSIASTNPDQATAELSLLMKNPAAAKYLGFTSTMDPKALIADIVSGKYAADQSKIAGLNVEINRQAKSNVPFTQALANYKQQGPVVWEGMTTTGKGLASSDLAAFNQARSSLGMGEAHKDGDGNIVDAQGNALTSDDFAETAAAADFLHRKDEINQQPWQHVYDQMMAGPLKDKILSIPGGDQKVKEALQIMYMGGNYKTDPSTGLMQPDFTNGMPWDNPSTAYLYHAWPTAIFGEGGDVMGKYDVGGDPYGLKSNDGTTLQKLPNDEHLDNLYAKYRYAGGNLDQNGWYFATAGGLMKPNEAKIPADVKAAAVENFQNVGGTSTTGTGTTGTGTMPAAAPDLTTPKGRQDAFSGAIGSSGLAFVNDSEKTNFTSTLQQYSNLAAKLDPTKIGGLPDNGTTQALLRSAHDRLKSLGVPDKTLGQNFDVSSQGSEVALGFGSGSIGNRHTAWDANQKAADYAIYANMLDKGMKEADAQKALGYLIGDARLHTALSLEPGHPLTIAPTDTSGAIGTSAAGLNSIGITGGG